MHIESNVSLKPYNTFGIEVMAKNFCNITSVDDLITILSQHNQNSLFVLGGGSNILLTKHIDDLVLHINLKGITITEETNDHVIVKVMAGENWHEFVLWCIKRNFGGVENLSLIPGNVGTAPIQNIGAYGVELKDCFVSCETLDIKTLNTTIFSKAECDFGYRDSVFKRELKGRCIITSVSFKLTKSHHKIKIDYGAISTMLASKAINDPTIKDVSDAVIAIRQSKLPDPNKIGNSGSFFKNPIISVEAFKKLKANFSNVPFYTISEREVKIPAGWLIETAGFKGKRFGSYGVHDKQALVLVNYDQAKGSDIYKLALLIQHTVKRLFDITLETEVNIV